MVCEGCEEGRPVGCLGWWRGGGEAAVAPVWEEGAGLEEGGGFGGEEEGGEETVQRGGAGGRGEGKEVRALEHDEVVDPIRVSETGIERGRGGELQDAA